MKQGKLNKIVMLVAPFVFALLLGVLPRSSASAVVNQYTTNGPYGVDVFSLAVSPNYSSDHTLFADTSGGVFASTNSGLSWGATNTGLPANAGRVSLAISPNYATDHTIFAGTIGGVYVSTDSGASWSSVNAGLPANTDVISLAISPNYAIDHTIFASIMGTSSGIYASTNSGASWNVTGFSYNPGIYSLAISPNYASDYTIFAGSEASGIFKSTNSGVNWSSSSTGLPASTPIDNLSVSPNFAADHIVFATANGRIFVSTNFGGSWSPANAGLPANTEVNSLAVSPSFGSDGIIFAGSPGGIFVSTDFGASWNATNTQLNNAQIISLAISPNFATDHTLFAGTIGGGVFIFNLSGIRNYFWTWYDNVGGDNWVLLANPSDASGALSYNLSIGDMGKLNGGSVAPGQSLPLKYDGVMGGPVEASSLSGAPGLVSQRTLWPKGGSSLEEVPGTEEDRLSNDLYWTWYDNKSPGFTNWVLIANPGVDHNGNTQGTVTAQIKVGGITYGTYSIAPGANVTPTFPGVIGGPVEVTVTGGDVMASQRVLSNYGAAFNEVPGIPAGELSDMYSWTWYDMQSPGAKNWVLIANPPGAAAPIYYAVLMGQNVVDMGGPIGAGQSVSPTFPGKMGGPMSVITFTDPNNISNSMAKSICSQRTIFGPSFEEVPGNAIGASSSRYDWTWYDQKSPGMEDWIMIANPDITPTDPPITATINIGGATVGTYSIAPGQSVSPTFPGTMDGPVEVEASNIVLASQRVLYNGYFNEVMGQ